MILFSDTALSLSRLFSKSPRRVHFRHLSRKELVTSGFQNKIHTLFDLNNRFIFQQPQDFWVDLCSPMPTFPLGKVKVL